MKIIYSRGSASSTTTEAVKPRAVLRGIYDAYGIPHRNFMTERDRTKMSLLDLLLKNLIVIGSATIMVCVIAWLVMP